jgi:hypothetical protein
MIGSSINPALGRIDYSPITQGAQSAAQSIQNAGQAYGQMFSNLGQQISGGIQQYQKNKEERDFYETAVRSKMGEAIQSMNQFKANPGLYNGKAPIRPEMLESISVEEIPKISIGKLKSYANELDGILQKSRGALAEANAIRQYEKDMLATQNDKFLGKALMSTQGLKVQDGVSTSIKQDFRAPLEGLKALNYGESVKQGQVGYGTSPSALSSKSAPSRSLALPRTIAKDYSTIPDSVKNFIIVNPVTGAAELNTDVVNKFYKDSDQIVNQKADLEYNVKSGTRPDIKVESFAGGVGGGFRRTPIERPMNPTEKIAANNVYKQSLQQFNQVQETQKALDEAQKIVSKDAMGATPVEIKTFISKDPNLTPVQSSAFEYVTKPEFRDATGVEKADKVVSEYLKQGGELGFEFLSKVKAAFKADVEMQDLGGGFGFVRVGNNVQIFDKNKKGETSAATLNRMDRMNYQQLLSASASFPTWESVPQVIKQGLAQLGGIYGEDDQITGRIAANNAWGKRRAELTGGQYSPTTNMLVKPAAAPPIGFTPTQPVR